MRPLLCLHGPLMLHVSLFDLEPLLCLDLVSLDLEGLLHLLLEAPLLVLEDPQLDTVPLLELLQLPSMLVSHHRVQLRPLSLLHLRLLIFDFLELGFKKGDLILMGGGVWFRWEGSSLG